MTGSCGWAGSGPSSAEVGPVGPFLLRQQQHAALIVVAELHLLAKLAEHLELAAGQIVSGKPGHALKHRGTSFLVVSADTQRVGYWQGRKLADVLSDLWRANTRRVTGLESSEFCGQGFTYVHSAVVRSGVTESTRPDYSVSKRPKAPSGRLGWNWLRRARRASYDEPVGARWPMRWSRRASTMFLPCRARAISMCSMACTRCVRSCSW